MDYRDAKSALEARVAALKQRARSLHTEQRSVEEELASAQRELSSLPESARATIAYRLALRLGVATAAAALLLVSSLFTIADIYIAMPSYLPRDIPQLFLAVCLVAIARGWFGLRGVIGDRLARAIGSLFLFAAALSLAFVLFGSVVDWSHRWAMLLTQGVRCTWIALWVLMAWGTWRVSVLSRGVRLIAALPMWLSAAELTLRVLHVPLYGSPTGAIVVSVALDALALVGLCAVFWRYRATLLRADSAFSQRC